MNKKQIIGLVIAAVVVVATGVIGISSAAREREAQQTALELFKSAAATSSNVPSADNIAVIEISGTIQASSSTTAGYDHDFVISTIEELKNSSSNKGILLKISSPGGTVYHSDETYLALLDYKEQTGRPVWAYSAEQTASGAYYIASAADKIYANRNSTVGSIGVYIQLTNMAELFDKLGISVDFVKSADNKAMGNAYNELTEEQRAIFQSEVDECYEQFLGVVCAGRGFTESELRPIADGRSYTAKQALGNGLIDGIALYDDVESDFMTLCGASEVYSPSRAASGLFNYLFSLAESLPRGEAEAVLDYAEGLESGVAMYYAG